MEAELNMCAAGSQTPVSRALGLNHSTIKDDIKIHHLIKNPNSK